jgi:hypothetical protein
MAATDPEEAGRGSVLGLWPLPRRAVWKRLLSVIGWVVEFAFNLAAGGTSQMERRRPAPEERLADARTAAGTAIDAALLGSASWCPSIPGKGVLKLDSTGASYEQGLPRHVPLDGLAPTAVHAPRTTSTPVRLPRTWWVLDLEGAAGSCRVAAQLDDLAVLGAWAGWPPPPGWRSGEAHR